MVQSFDQLNPPLEHFAVRQALLLPAIEHAVNAKTLLAAKLLVQEICVVNDFRNYAYLAIVNSKCLLQRLKRAIFATMTEAGVEHVEGNRVAWNFFFPHKGKSCFLID